MKLSLSYLFSFLTILAVLDVVHGFDEIIDIIEDIFGGSSSSKSKGSSSGKKGSRRARGRQRRDRRLNVVGENMFEEDEMWKLYKSSCKEFMYRVQMCVTGSGHVEAWIMPADEGQNAPEECAKILIADIATIRATGENVKRVKEPGDELTEWGDCTGQELGDLYKLEHLVDAFEGDKITTSDNSAMYDSVIPMNCASFFLNVGKTLGVPIGAEMVKAISTRVSGTQFMTNFMASSYPALLDTTVPASTCSGWCDELPAGGAKTVCQLFVFMIGQHEYEALESDGPM